VELAVSLAHEQGGPLTTILAAVFLAVSLTFVYRSFYGMRIEAEEEPAAARPVAARRAG
jgi:K(+)-stimulated pyrophosphate-energized sodium pump